jgi:drug/metabolite transporter (DMT)-like permease
MLPASLIVDRPFHLSPSPLALAAWAALTLLGTVLAYLIYFTLIERTSATFVTMVTYIIPINGLILGALVLKERLTPTILVSLALVLLGVLLVNGSWRLLWRRSKRVGV